MCITLADVVYVMIVTTHIYMTTKSATTTALFPLFGVIASLIASISAPLIMNRFRSYSLLFTLQGIKTFLLIFLTVLFSLVSSNITALLIFIILISLCGGWSSPLLYAVIPSLTSQEKLVKVNSVFSFSTQIVQAAAYSFTSVVVLFIGATSTLIINNILMILGCIALYISLRTIQVEQTTEKSASKSATLIEGWKLLFQQPSLLSKIYTAHGTLTSAVSGISMLSVGIITDMFGVRTIYIIAAFLILCSACLSFILLKQTKQQEKDVSL